MTLFGGNDGHVQMSRAWCMPSPDTFSMKPAANLASRWLRDRCRIIDPFARNSKLAHVTNDLSMEFATDFHMDAPEFLRGQHDPMPDAVILDPPYSPRQMAEAYASVGRSGIEISQNARLYKECKDAIADILHPGGVVICVGWNSSGMGKGRGFVMREILLVCCGGAHNDYIFTVETRA